MIDTKELREKITIKGLDVVADTDILEVLDRLEAAENENAKLRIALAEKVTSEATLRDLNFGNGFINATFEGGAVQLMVDALADQFVESGASNYIEMQFHSNATGPLLFTLQRVDGKTPHQLRAEAEKERDALRTKIEAMEKQAPVAAQHRFRHPHKNMPDWTDWWPCEVSKRPAWEVDSQGYEVEYRALYALPGAKGETK